MSNVNFFAISGLINGITSTVLAIFVHFKGKKGPLYKTYVFFCLSVAVWSYFYFAWQIAETESMALFCSRGLMAGAIFIPIFYLHHVLALVGKSREKRKVIIFGYLFGLTSLMLDFTPYFVSGVSPKLYFKYWPDPGVAYHLFLLLWAYFVIYGVVIIVNSYKYAKGIKRNQLKYVLVATLFGWTGGATNYPLWYNIPLPPVGNILVSVYMIITSYAIIKYRLMDILVVINKSVLFIIITVLVFVFHGIFTSILEPILGLYLSTALSLSIIIFILFFTPLRPKLASLVDHYVYRGKYDYHDIIKDAAGKVVSILELDDLLEYLLSTIQKALGVEKVCLLLKEESGQEVSSGEVEPNFYIRASKGLDKEFTSGFSIQNGLIHYLDKNREPAVREELEKMLPPEEVSRLYQKISPLSPVLAIPLFYGERMIGVLTLDNKVNNEPYSTADINLLRFLAEQASTALENARLYHEAVTDGLTKVYHYRYFKMRLEEEINRSRRYNHPLSLLMIDIDFFKHFNDTYGHLNGDKALKGLVTILKETVRPTDVVCRYGGEEFTIILPDTGKEEARLLAEKIRMRIAESQVGPSPLTVSIGVSVLLVGMDRDSFIRAADTAMYEAKKNGRNRVEVL